MSSDRQRNKRDIKSKRVILVALEGKNKTEKNYFDNFNNRDKNYVIKTVPGNETDTVNLVKQAVKTSYKLSLNEDDKIFCIFDTDINQYKNKQINEALLLAKENNVTIITSSPCIEIWFLLHFLYTTSNMNSDDVIKKLRSFYPKYNKNCNIYPFINNNINKACERAKTLEKYHVTNNRNIESVEANPHSDVYKIVEELVKIN